MRGREKEMGNLKVYKATKEEQLVGCKKALEGLKKNLVGVYVGDDYAPTKIKQLEDGIKNMEEKIRILEEEIDNEKDK